MHVLALVLALLQPEAPSSPAPVPEETAQVFRRILVRTPAFAPGMQRTLGATLVGITPPQAPFPVFVVEVPWSSKSGAGTAVALFIDVPGFALANRIEVNELLRQLKGAEGSWGLAELSEGKTLAAWMEEKNAQRRQLNEASAVGDLRTMSSLQETLRSTGGHYGQPECLAEPAACFGAWTAAPLPQFVLTGDKAGYRRTFHPGPVVAQKGKLSSKLLQSWALTAKPLSPDTGRRAFCIDATGVVCATADGTMAPVVDGACPKACPPLP